MEDQGEQKANDSVGDTLPPPPIHGNARQKKTTQKKAKTPVNPYANTDIVAIKILRKQTRDAKLKALAKIHRPTAMATPTLKEIDEEEKDREERHDRLSEVGRDQDVSFNFTEGKESGRASRQSMLPPVEHGKALTSTRSRYSSESMRSLYLHDEEKRKKRPKASAVTRATTLGLITEVGGGSLYTYTGVQRLGKDNLKQNADRLSHCLPDKVPDANRVVSSRVVDKCGLTVSFQWTAGGKRCHGFIW